MWFNLLFVIFVVATCLNYMFLDIKVDKIKRDIKVDKIKRDSLNKDQVIASLIAHNKALYKLNAGFKDHERRLDNVEKLLLPEESKKFKNTCNDCKYYNRRSGAFFKCEKFDFSFPIECDNACSSFEKKESLDEDENFVYANNVKVDISSKGPIIYKFNGSLLTQEDYAKRITKLCLDGGISFADANALLERIKQ